MANLARVRCTWSGAPVTGPGLSTFYFAEAGSGFTAALSTFWQAVDAYIPIGVTVTVPSTGDLLDIATGDLTGTWSDAASGPGTGAGFGAFPAGVGARITWPTSGIVGGRRVVGSTFLAPLVNSVFGTDGTLDSTFLTAILTPVGALWSGAGYDMMIWSRPVPGRAGEASEVIDGTVPDKVSWLRSRRT